jgi:hypothetical protein
VFWAPRLVALAVMIMGRRAAATIRPRSCFLLLTESGAAWTLGGIGRASKRSVRVVSALFGEPILAVYPCGEVGVPGTPETLSTRSPYADGFKARLPPLCS